MGNFNLHYPKIAKYLSDIGLHGSIKTETATHNHGNHLNKIFTNQSVLSASCDQAPFPSDHLIIST